MLIVIDINKIPSRLQRIAVTVTPAEWQTYIAH